MTWARDYKVAQDHSLGLQTINRAVANVESLYAAYQLEHHLDGVGWPGSHWHQVIPKAWGTVIPTTLIPGTVDLTTNVVGDATVTRSDVGFYLITSPFSAPAWSDVDPIATSGTPVRRSTGFMNAPTTDGWSIVVVCMELVAGTFIPSDFSFSFVLCAGG